MKQAIKKLIPKAVFRTIDLQKEVRDLAALGSRSLDHTNLRTDLPNLADPALMGEWETAQKELAPLQIEDKAGAVNPGDRRAIYHLARALKPRTVLEVGTHLGASTTTLCLAMMKNGISTPKLISVDIRDVNGPEGAWVQFGSKHSPRSATQALGCGFVEFVTSPSLRYLQTSGQKFDLIFLDGGHEAATVYQEVPAALKLLNPGGLILLHDVYPDRKPLWSDGVVVPGPWLAIERFAKEGARVRVQPLGALPWPTKLGSNVTSLAVMLGA